MPSSSSRSRWLWILLLAVGLLRLLSLGMYALMDTTEARYAEIVRIMVETGNWITPQIDYGVPFWGKPPLYVWASAISLELFGNNEFSQRLPHFIAALLILLVIWRFALYLKLSRNQALFSMAIVATSVGFIITSGTVMTDTLLTLSMTLSMVGFWRGWHGERAWNYVMYAGLGIGLLAKGPLIIVLVGLALFPWLVWQVGLVKMWKQIWLRLNLISGLALMSLIALPWYLLAEQATPGFLQYFIIGEHYQRFIDSGWQGDLYGSGHPRAKGMIWYYWFVFALPWSLVLLWGGARRLLKKSVPPSRDQERTDKGLTLFLILWMGSPLILFTMAANILEAYVFPGIPALGLLIITTLHYPDERRGRWLYLVGPLLFLVFISIVIFKADDERSEKALFAQGIDSDEPVYYLTRRPYSAQYYSNGKAKRIRKIPEHGRFYLVIKPIQLNKTISTRCQQRSQNNQHILLFCQ
jgi:4-amino-4-deoxy-L-arabinose transferase-like glycosyltransferase